MKSVAELSGVKPSSLYRQYKEHSSGFRQWNQLPHASDWLLFEQNVGAHLSIDEVSLSQGELYTFITNKEGKGKQGSLVGCLKGTRSADIVRLLQRLGPQKRDMVKEISLDMAKNMESAMQTSFPQAELVTDRFHVMALAYKQLQLLRTGLWRVCLEQENEAIEQARKTGKPYRAREYYNGDTPKQLLARARFALFKPASTWTRNQSMRIHLLFRHYPSLKLGYEHVQELVSIYSLEDRSQAKKQLVQWIERTKNPSKNNWNDLEIATLKTFQPTANSISYHLESILNFFNNRSTNANAESFNAKIKLFRSKLKGVSDTSFFLFRLSKLFA